MYPGFDYHLVEIRKDSVIFQEQKLFVLYHTVRDPSEHDNGSGTVKECLGEGYDEDGEDVIPSEEDRGYLHVA